MVTHSDILTYMKRILKVCAQRTGTIATPTKAEMQTPNGVWMLQPPCSTSASSVAKQATLPTPVRRGHRRSSGSRIHAHTRAIMQP